MTTVKRRRGEAADLRRVVRLMDLSGWALIRSVLALVVTLAAALALAGLSAWLITKAWTMPPALALTIAATAVRGLGVARGLFRYLERLATHDLSLRAMERLRVTFYERLAYGRPEAALHSSAARLAERGGRDIDTVGAVVARTLVVVPAAVVLAAAATLWLALITPSPHGYEAATAVAALVVGLMICGIVVPRLTIHGARAAATQVARQREELTQAVLTLVRHGDELAVAGQYGRYAEAARRAERDRYRAVRRAARSDAYAAALAPAGQGLSVLALLVIGAVVTAAGPVPPTTVGIMLLLPLAAFEATSLLPDAALQWRESAIAAHELVTLLDAADDKPSGPGGFGGCRDATTALVHARALRWGWNGRALPQTPLTLDVHPGDRILVTGPSGSGKTALGATLAGLLPPVSGTVVTDAERVRLFAEDAHIFDTTIRENLRVERGQQVDSRLPDVLAAVGLQRWVAALPNGIDTRLRGGAAALSGGQRRRLLLARALLSTAEVIILDEPTEHLDRDDATRYLQKVLAPQGLFGPQRAVVVISHQGLEVEVGQQRIDLDGRAHHPPR